MLRRDAENTNHDHLAGPSLDHVDLVGSYPELVSFLGSTVWPEDGSPRETGTLLVCAGDGRLRACLNDRAQGKAAWVSSESLQGLLDVLECKLASAELEWRSNRPPQAKRK